CLIDQGSAALARSLQAGQRIAQHRASALEGEEVAMSESRRDILLDEALRLRLSRRSIMRQGAALGLSAAAISGVLATSGRASAARRAPAFIQERTLNTLQATYF